jgi:hypothetical protein
LIEKNGRRLKKKMWKKQISIVAGIIMTLMMTIFVPLVFGVGMYPAEMRVTNAVGTGVVGDIVCVNTDNESKYIVLKVEAPSNVSSELQHLRVICEDCHASLQRYMVANGTCPKCGSRNLTFYDVVPDEILDHITLRGKDCMLTRNGNVYTTVEQYPFKGQCNVEILLDLPPSEKYANKHREARITVTTTSDPNAGGVGVVAGVSMRLLLDVPVYNASSLSFGKPSLVMFGVIGGGLIGLFCVLYIYTRRHAKKSTRDIKRKPKHKPVSAKTRYQKEPFSIRHDLVKDIRDIGVTNSIKFDHKHPTFTRGFGDSEPFNVRQHSHGNDVSGIETEIDRILKSRRK